MGIEIEKKYRLTRKQHEQLIRRLRECSAVAVGEDFEENTLYAGGNLQTGKQALRLRRIGGRAILTYKERYASTTAIKHQREDETGIEDAQALAAILDALGYKPALIYEKRRATWQLKGAEVMIDELPFGLFAEIEGEENAILEVEEQLGLADAEAEMATYPELTRRHGEKRGDVIEARFQMTLPEI
ncbi:MAG: adenylate cyclase, class 2 [Acidobacteriota bacterium]|jgi:adenylate cyclase class 2|nr:adenylate cyclase, class 2 [Acidobacteriota bacterium]